MALHTLCLKVTTGGYPNKIDVNYKCQFINLSERRAYQKYKMMESDPESQGVIKIKNQNNFGSIIAT